MFSIIKMSLAMIPTNEENIGWCARTPDCLRFSQIYAIHRMLNIYKHDDYETPGKKKRSFYGPVEFSIGDQIFFSKKFQLESGQSITGSYTTQRAPTIKFCTCTRLFTRIKYRDLNGEIKTTKYYIDGPQINNLGVEEEAIVMEEVD